MGYFTWTFANKPIKKVGYGYSSDCKLGYGYRGYIALPKEMANLYKDVVFNKEGYPFIQENCYDGYGMFGLHDAYDVIVDINRGYLTNMFVNPSRCGWEFLKPIAEIFDKGLENTKEFKALIKEIASKHGAYLEKDWKRNLGIEISCYLEDNERLKYPLKITSSKNCKYEELPPSDSTQ